MLAFAAAWRWASTFRRVVLPEPLAPIRASSSPVKALLPVHGSEIFRLQRFRPGLTSFDGAIDI